MPAKYPRYHFDYASFGAAVKAARIDRSILAMAKYLRSTNLSPVTLRRVERGTECGMNVQTLVTLCRTFELDPNDYFREGRGECQKFTTRARNAMDSDTSKQIEAAT